MKKQESNEPSVIDVCDDSGDDTLETGLHNMLTIDSGVVIHSDDDLPSELEIADDFSLECDEKIPKIKLALNYGKTKLALNSATSLKIDRGLEVLDAQRFLYNLGPQGLKDTFEPWEIKYVQGDNTHEEPHTLVKEIDERRELLKETPIICNLRGAIQHKHYWTEFLKGDIQNCWYRGNLGIFMCESCEEIVDVFPCTEKRVYTIPKTRCTYCTGSFDHVTLDNFDYFTAIKHTAYVYKNYTVTDACVVKKRKLK